MGVLQRLGLNSNNKGDVGGKVGGVLGVSQSRSGQDKVNNERVNCRWWTEGTHPCHRTWNPDGTTREESGVYIQAGKWRPCGWQW